MTDLARFFVYSSSDGDLSLDCYACSWSSGYDEFPDDLAGIVALAETHRCPVVIDGASEIVRPAIEAAR